MVALFFLYAALQVSYARLFSWLFLFSIWFLSLSQPYFCDYYRFCLDLFLFSSILTSLRVAPGYLRLGLHFFFRYGGAVGPPPALLLQGCGYFVSDSTRRYSRNATSPQSHIASSSRMSLLFLFNFFANSYILTFAILFISLNCAMCRKQNTALSDVLLCHNSKMLS